MLAMVDLYYNQLRISQRRLLNLLDRNPASKTYGCFDRSYWLHRKSDYAISTAQLSTATLAYFYKTSFPGNMLYQQPTCLEWIIAAVKFTLSLQHRDGSFDEWYPNERGWGGPTGYLTHALMETLRMVGPELSDELKVKMRRQLLLSAWHLNRRDEGDVLANHYAISLLAITNVAEYFDSPELREASKRWLLKFRDFVTDEGWSLEYDGCDLGYNLATLNFFADLHRLTSSTELVSYARRAFGFLSHFAYPDGSWAGSLGSRHTRQSYFYGLEYWSQLIDESHALLHHQREALKKSLDLSPMDQEDHYLHYRLSDYAKAALNFCAKDLTDTSLPYEATDFEGRTFAQAGFKIEKRGNILLWAALHRGGAFRLYNNKTKQALRIDNGCLVETHKGTYTSLWQNSAGSPSDLVATGRLQRLFNQRFAPLSFLLFRICCLLMTSPGLAFLFKKWIRRQMITQRPTKNSPRWRREFQWLDHKLIVKDELTLAHHRLKSLFWGGEFHTRYVPQAQYFSEDELKFPPQRLSKETFKDRNSVRLKTEICLDTGEFEVCAE